MDQYSGVQEPRKMGTPMAFWKLWTVDSVPLTRWSPIRRELIQKWCWVGSAFTSVRLAESWLCCSAIFNLTLLCYVFKIVCQAFRTWYETYKLSWPRGNCKRLRTSKRYDSWKATLGKSLSHQCIKIIQPYPRHGLATLKRSLLLWSVYLSLIYGLTVKILERSWVSQCHLETYSVYQHFNRPVKHSWPTS